MISENEIISYLKNVEFCHNDSLFIEIINETILFAKTKKLNSKQILCLISLLNDLWILCKSNNNIILI